MLKSTWNRSCDSVLFPILMYNLLEQLKMWGGTWFYPPGINWIVLVCSCCDLMWVTCCLAFAPKIHNQRICCHCKRKGKSFWLKISRAHAFNSTDKWFAINTTLFHIKRIVNFDFIVRFYTLQYFTLNVGCQTLSTGLKFCR